MPFVYMVRCADGSLYTGYAEDVDRRIAAHNAGTGARYTSGRRPVRLVFTEACESRGHALRREHQLKRLSRVEKEAVIAAFRSARRRARRAPHGEAHRHGGHRRGADATPAADRESS